MEILETNTDECQVWPYGKSNTSGYAQVTGKCQGHVLMCTLIYGDRPSRKAEVMHSCNNRLCINKKHLSWGDKSKNLVHRWKTAKEDHKQRFDKFFSKVTSTSN